MSQGLKRFGWMIFRAPNFGAEPPKSCSKARLVRMIFSQIKVSGFDFLQRKRRKA